MAKKVTKHVLAALLIFAAVICAMFPLIGAKASAESAEMPALVKGGTSKRAVVIADYDNCLTASEEAALIKELESAANKAKCNIGIVITSDLGGMSDKKYADSFSDYYFGYGSNSVVLMLLNSYNKPEYSRYEDWISTSGQMKDRLQKRIDRMFDRIYDKMGEPKGNKYAYNESTHTYGGYNYVAACKEFAACVKRYGVGGFPGLIQIIIDYILHSFMYFAGGIVLAFLISKIIVKVQVSKYKKKAPISAVRYMDRSATRVTRQVDQFIREYTTSHTHSSGGGHGGGHGGGGHGGGGGHHR